MRAIVITAPGGPEVLGVRDVPAPEPGPSSIRVRVAASGVNRADLLQRAGGYPAPPGWPADIPGLEYAGVVDAVGEGVRQWRAGDRVMGLVGGGGYAEYVVVHEAEALSVPEQLPLVLAAAVPEAFITAHDALFTRMRLTGGERLLVHAVGSGVGTAALQMANVAGARVFGSARTAAKLERCRALGLDVAIDASREDFADVVARETDGAGVHGILDLVGGDYLSGNLRALALLGRIIVVGLVAGPRAELDMRLLLRKRATLCGTVLRSRTAEEKIEATRAFAEFALPLLEAGRIAPVIDTVLPAIEAARAHERVASNLGFGKVVLRWEDA